MGEITGIQWTDHTFNPWLGCSKVSAECDRCYAEKGSARLAAKHGLKLWDDGSSRYFTSESYWKQPAKWNRAAQRDGVRRRVFCASFADVFEDRPDVRNARTSLLRIIEGTPCLDWQLLTKRPENMIRLTSHVWPGDWPSNVWAGTTVGATESLGRIDHLRKVPASVRFISCEPMIGDVPFDAVFGLKPGNEWAECLCDDIHPSDRPCLTCEGRRSLGEASGIHQVIVGGESGAGARPFNVAHARVIRDLCKSAGVAFFMKQLGAKPFDGDRPIHLKDSHGGNWDEVEWPSDIRIREFPHSSVHA